MDRGLVLLLDAGNSRLKWCVVSTKPSVETLSQKHRFHDVVFADYPSEDRVLAEVVEAFQHYAKKPEYVWVSNVRSLSFVEALHGLCTRLAWPEAEYICSTRAAYGIVNAYQHPKMLGVDRFVGLVAVHALYPKSACILVDSGTAVTIDAILANGEHQGGVILPGLSLWHDNLVKGTTALNKNLIYNPNEGHLFARNTGAGVLGGRTFGLALAIEGICLRMENKLKEEHLGASVTCIVCGGDAQHILSVLDEGVQQAYHLHKHLILTGLEIIAKRQWECVG